MKEKINSILQAAKWIQMKTVHRIWYAYNISIWHTGLRAGLQYSTERARARVALASIERIHNFFNGTTEVPTGPPNLDVSLFQNGLRVL